MTNEFELHADRLATSDASGKRVFLHPADVKGFFRIWRSKVQAVLILLFLGLPWVKINGHQALLLNIADRQFEIFGLSLRAHNAPLLLLVFAAAAFGLFFATAVYGRIWCGWACPQTVFIDGVFRRIERMIEGAALERRRLDKAPWTLMKVSKRILKWALFIFTSLILTHSFLAYFVGTEKLAKMIQSSPLENRGDFIFMLLTSGIILFDFGWFREQFCTLICPYGRFQSVLMDKRSLVVSYDVARGEPRSTPQAKVLAKTHNAKLGDCVNCYRCVQVCPTGIDIRRGVQMECIACTACIDACDDVMTKIKKPPGLIRYHSPLKKRWNARAVSYLTLCLLSICALAFLLSILAPVDIEIFRAKEAPYSKVQLPDGSNLVINHFVFELGNRSGENRELAVGIASPVDKTEDVQLIMAAQPLSMTKDQVTRADVFIRFPQATLENGKKSIRIFIKDLHSKENAESFYKEKELTLVGPFT